ncbi:hypothetical protein TELCIR_09469 [Teladorsagia circumcincta]|uniref:Uncharacterized protein n=1 Tax=Teladorsagia circumcincta TaxID=45464 RepID=A0A2G9UEU0_TELCI|nr:hypothetical protein TELCIR_09469 [Teladorsagia circumcincta]
MQLRLALVLFAIILAFGVLAEDTMEEDTASVEVTAMEDVEDMAKADLINMVEEEASVIQEWAEDSAMVDMAAKEDDMVAVSVVNFRAKFRKCLIHIKKSLSLQ